MHPGISASINTEPEYAHAPITTKSCLLCYAKIPEGSETNPSPSPKLYELCCKYLRAALILEHLANHKDGEIVRLCLNCYTSAIKLANLTDEMDFIQKNVFESVIRFSMEILRRRGQATTNHDDIGEANKSGNKRVEIDVSTLPNFNFWAIPPSNLSSCSPEESIFKNNYCGQLEGGPSVVSAYGNNENSAQFTPEETRLKNSLENCIGEGFVNYGGELHTPKPDTLKNIDQTMMLKLQRQKFHSGADDSKKDEINKSIWTGTKNELGRSYKVSDECPTVPYNRCNGDPHAQFQYSVNGPASSASLRPTPIEENKSKHQMAGESLYGSSSVQQAPHAGVSKPSSSVHGKTTKKKSKAQAGKSPFIWNLIAKKQCCSWEHPGVPPYNCDCCSKGFNEKRGVTRHQKLQAKTQFKCLMCGKEFVWKSDLVRHARSHTGEKPFKCDECDFSSNQYAHLKLHKNRRHSNLSNFRCKQCGKYFKTTVDVKQHFKRVHFPLDYSDDFVVKVTS